MRRWPMQWKEQIVAVSPYFRRGEIARKFGWTQKQKSRICANRARMIMDFLKADWPAVRDVYISNDNLKHIEVYDRIYDWCVIEVQKIKKKQNCQWVDVLEATVTIQSAIRRYTQRHLLNRRLPYTTGQYLVNIENKKARSERIMFFGKDLVIKQIAAFVHYHNL